MTNIHITHIIIIIITIAIVIIFAIPIFFSHFLLYSTIVEENPHREMFEMEDSIEFE